MMVLQFVNELLEEYVICLKKPICSARNADWLSELSSVINKCNNTIHHSIKMTPIEASKKIC